MDNLEFDHRATRARPSGVFESLRLGPAESEPAECAATETLDARDYRSDLATTDLIIEVRRLLTTQRRVERLICRYLADLADRVNERSDRELEAFLNELDAAKAIFGLGARRTRERIRVGRALRRLPSIEHAFIAGDISYSRVREVTRVAQPDTESSWLELAQSLDMRSLERQVVAATPRPVDAPAPHGDTPGAHLRAGDDWTSNDWRAERDGLGDDDDGHDDLAGFARDDANSFASLDDPADLHGHDDDADCFSHHHEQPGFPSDGTIGFVGCHAGAGFHDDDDQDDGKGGSLNDASENRAFSRNACDPAGGNARDPAKRRHARASTEWTGRDSVRVTFELTADAWALLERALDGARRCGEAHADTTAFDDGEALEAIARDALSFQNASRGKGAGEINGANPCPDSLPPSPGSDSVSRATQGGSSTTTRLLQIIGRRGGWTIDDLIERSGLPIADVQHALLLLQLQDRIRHRGYQIDPT